jgi:carboxyl-terminal processing protease
MAKFGKKGLLLIAIMIVLTVGARAAMHFRHSEEEKGFHDYVKMFKEVLAIVKQKYVEDVDEKKLIRSAINGMLASLDPHNAYLPPEPYKEMKIQMSGSFGGVGIEITIKDDRLTVIAPIEETPAFRAGIKANDHIWKIDDKPTRDLKINEAVNLMRGEKGTRVTLTIIREGVNKPLVFPLVRDIIQTKSLRSRTVQPGYGYVKINVFQERTAEDLAKALQNLRTENGGALKGLILDLRNNPGGLLEPAVAVAGRFIGEKLDNGLVVSIKGRNESEKKDLSASIGDKEPRYPMVILINGGSASASEIVAGALQDHKRAVIMGTQSFGKGSVQSIIPLREGAGLKLTTARYYTPKGRSIQAKGITPDIIVGSMHPLTTTSRAGKEFREKDLEGHIGNGKKSEGEKESLPQQVTKPDDTISKDFPLLRALELLQSIDAMNRLEPGR